jgi:hypothetical protein
VAKLVITEIVPVKTEPKVYTGPLVYWRNVDTLSVAFFNLICSSVKSAVLAPKAPYC